MISIIVPVYNVEEYLDRCVQSLVEQTYSDIEIILVNDGSTDSSGKVCEKWAQRDKRIVFVEKENGGLSDARNYGISIARGSYLGFVDSDDFVHPRMFEILLRDLDETGADIATCDVADVFDKQPIDFGEQTIERPYAVDAQTALKGMACSDLPRIWVPTRLYPRFVFERGFRFPLGKAYEDAYTIVELMSLVGTVSINKSQLYYYCHRDQTITTSGYSAKTHDVIVAWEHGRELVEELFPSLRDDFLFRCLWSRCMVLDKLVVDGTMDNSPQEVELVDYIRSHYSEVSRHPSLTSQRKALCSLLQASLPLYRATVRIWRSKNRSFI